MRSRDQSLKAAKEQAGRAMYLRKERCLTSTVVGTTTCTTDVIKGSADIELWGGARTAIGAGSLERSSRSHIEFKQQFIYAERHLSFVFGQSKVGLMVGSLASQARGPGLKSHGVQRSSLGK